MAQSVYTSAYTPGAIRRQIRGTSEEDRMLRAFKEIAPYVDFSQPNAMENAMKHARTLSQPGGLKDVDPGGWADAIRREGVKYVQPQTAARETQRAANAEYTRPGREAQARRVATQIANQKSYGARIKAEEAAGLREPGGLRHEGMFISNEKFRQYGLEQRDPLMGTAAPPLTPEQAAQAAARREQIARAKQGLAGMEGTRAQRAGAPAAPTPQPSVPVSAVPSPRGAQPGGVYDQTMPVPPPTTTVPEVHRRVTEAEIPGTRNIVGGTTPTASYQERAGARANVLHREFAALKQEWDDLEKQAPTRTGADQYATRPNARVQARREAIRQRADELKAELDTIYGGRIPEPKGPGHTWTQEEINDAEAAPGAGSTGPAGQPGAAGPAGTTTGLADTDIEQQRAHIARLESEAAAAAPRAPGRISDTPTMQGYAFSVETAPLMTMRDNLQKKASALGQQAMDEPDAKKRAELWKQYGETVRAQRATETKISRSPEAPSAQALGAEQAAIQTAHGEGLLSKSHQQSEARILAAQAADYTSMMGQPTPSELERAQRAAPTQFPAKPPTGREQVDRMMVPQKDANGQVQWTPEQKQYWLRDKGLSAPAQIMLEQASKYYFSDDRPDPINPGQIIKKDPGRLAAAEKVIRRYAPEWLEGGEPTTETPAAQGGSVPQIKTDEEFDALPTGSEFIDPEGKRRKKGV